MQRWYLIHVPVFTFSDLLTGCTNGAVRLTGGHHAAEGNIEVCYNQTWRLVSSLRWTTSNTNVVCRQLGYTSQGSNDQ